MSKLKRFITSLSVLLLMSGTAAVPVYARGQSSQDLADAGSGTPLAEPAGSDNHPHDMAQQFMQNARQTLSAERQKNKEQTREHRQQACIARKNSLAKRMSQAVAQAKKHKAVFDKVYSRVKTFHDTKQLNVPDYDTLTALANTAQTSAQESIDALQTLDVSVDCSSQTVADNVSAFQLAVKTTRDNLKNYRTAIVNITKALKASAPDDSPAGASGQSG